MAAATQHGFDFHLHSWYSYDARLSPEEVLQAADRAGVTALAFTDHHNMDGFPAFKRAAGAFPAVRWITGMEVAVATRSGGCEVVALGMPDDAHERMEDVIGLYREWQRDFNRCLLAGFKALDVPFDEADRDEMLAAWRPGPAHDLQGETRLPNEGLRPWMVDHGILADAGEFDDLRRRALAQAGDKPTHPPAERVLPRFKAEGAVLILAHPGGLLEERGELHLDGLVEELDLDGVEAGHYSHPPERARRYLDFARSRGLLVSGGTDAHFPEGLDAIGRHQCPADWAAALLERLGV